MRRFLVVIALLLTACSSSGDEAATSSGSLPDISGSKAGAFNTDILAGQGGSALADRPTANLGIFTSMYLSQGAFLPAQSAMLGIDAQEMILEGQTQVQSDETFALLTEYGAILQVDVIDMLNRSNDRAKALDTYTESLTNLTKLVNRKQRELGTLVDELDDQIRAAKKEARDIDHVINRAIDDEDYELAGSRQQELAEAKAKVAELEAKRKQTKEIISIFEKLQEIAQQRLLAITENRRIILAGLKVVEVPGIEEFDILDETSLRSSRKQRDALNPLGIFGFE